MGERGKEHPLVHDRIVSSEPRLLDLACRTTSPNVKKGYQVRKESGAFSICQPITFVDGRKSSLGLERTLFRVEIASSKAQLIRKKGSTHSFLVAQD